MWLNSVYGRGIATFDGANSASGGTTAALVANSSYAQMAGVEGYTNNTFLTSAAIRGFNTASSGGNGVYGTHTGTGTGVLGTCPAGNGVYGSGTNGVYGSGSTTGVYGTGTSFGVYSAGPIGTSSNSFVNNLYANYSYIMIGAASSTPLYFYQGPTTGSSVATFIGTNKPGTSSVSNSWLEFIINGTSYQIPVWAS